MKNELSNSKVFALVSRMNSKEAVEFSKFLKSPYFNSSQDLLKLFRYLHDAIAKNKNISKANLWKKLVSNKPYNDTRFRKYCSDLTRLAERFLSQQMFDQDEFQKRLYFWEVIRSKEIDKLKSNLHSDIPIGINPGHPEYFSRKYILEQKLYDIHNYQERRSEKANLQSMLDNLEKFYVSQALNLYNSMVTRNTVLTQKYDLSSLNYLMDLSSIEKLKEEPLISVTRDILTMEIHGEEEEHYYAAKKSLQDNYDQIAKNILLDSYYSLINYCRLKTMGGKSDFVNEMFDLYNDLINSKLLFKDDKLSPWDFNNIMSASLRLGKYQWAEKFIHEYSGNLPKEVRENSVTYNLGVLYYYQKKYDQAIEQLSFVEYEEISYNLNSKILLLAIYYEIDEYDPLFSLFDSFSTYLNRHKEIPSSSRKYYLNLIKFTRRLAKIRPNDQNAINKLKNDIVSTNELASKSWLLKRVEELV